MLPKISEDFLDLIWLGNLAEVQLRKRNLQAHSSGIKWIAFRPAISCISPPPSFFRSAALFTVASIGALGYVALADEGIVLGFPLLARIAAFMWERPYIGGVVRWGYDKLLKFTQTGLPTLTVLWTNYGNLKDYLAHNDSPGFLQVSTTIYRPRYV